MTPPPKKDMGEHTQTKHRRAERAETRTVWASSWQEMVTQSLEGVATGV